MNGEPFLRESGHTGSLRAGLCVLLVLAALTFCLTPAAAGDSDKIAVDPLWGNEGCSAVLYDNTNGLPTSEANTITETEDGFLWIGCYGGLIRYDGKTFERIDSTTGISSVVSLFADSRARLWIGTNDSGVAVMEKGSLRIYNKEDGLRSLFVHSVTEDQNGTIYIGTTQGIAIVGEDMELRTMDEPQIVNENTLDLSVGIDNVVYGRTNDGAVFTAENGKLTGFYEGAKLGISGIHSIVPDQSAPGQVYLGTTGSEIYHGDLRGGAAAMERIDISPLAYVNSISQIRDQIWICADNGAGVVGEHGCAVLENVPLNSSVEQMMTDYQGNLWFASSKQGVMKIVPNQFTDLFEQNGLNSEVVNSTCVYGDLLFVGCKKSGLFVLGEDGVVDSLPLTGATTASGEELEATDLIELLRGCQIRSIVRDSQNRLWISSYGKNGLIRYDGKRIVCFTTKDGIPSERVRTVVERADGSFLAACTGGLALIEGDRVTEVYGEDSGIRNTEILTVAEGYNGDIILGTDGDGIYVITGSKVVHLGLDSGLPSEVVMRVKRGRFQDLYWIVASNAIAYMTPDYQIKAIRSFPYSNNFDLYENGHGEAWILSGNGIYETATEELLANGEISPVFYDRHNGLPCIPSANSYSGLAEDGTLYIAGTTGVVKVNIDKPFESVSNVKMSVPYVEADGTRTYPDETGVITIPSGVKKLTIHGHVFTYSLMDPLVTYYLDGFDRAQTSLRRSELDPVDYTNLNGGSYRFVMRLKDSLGQDGSELSVTIVKQKALFEQLWFQILCGGVGVILVAAIVMLVARHKMKALRKKEQEQREFVREVTEVLAKTIDMKDKYTKGHSIRVARYTAMLAKELGLDPDTVEKYYNIALLHDIGKISVPPEVLNKNGKLDDEEFRIIKSHSELGYNALKEIRIIPELAVGAGAHHERPDGKGYPNGLSGEEIPRVAQIIAVADTFDAMYSDRPYRKRMNFDKVVSIMREVSGTQLASDVVDAFLRLVEKGQMRAPDDTGGGSTEDIDNIRRKFEQEARDQQSPEGSDTPPPEEDPPRKTV